MAEALPARDEIETKYKWNAESVFPTVAAWDAEATAVTTAIDALKVAGVDMTTPAEKPGFSRPQRRKGDTTQ